MKRPAHIDGITRICCGNRVEQCEDCPMIEWHEKMETPPLIFDVTTRLWVNTATGNSYPTWQEARDD